MEPVALEPLLLERRDDVTAGPVAGGADTTRLDPVGPGLYVHVPFCEARCSYCDFYAVARDQAPRRQIAEALAVEAAARTPTDFAPVTTFVGGGTPTALTDEELRDVLDVVSGVAQPGGRLSEWTVECNPGSFTPTKARLMRAAGVNRVSIGVQSFDDAVLRSVGRVHDAATARDAVRIARDAGIEQVSVDLLFAVPGQGLETFRRDLDEAVVLGTDHVSAYALIFEPGTPLRKHLDAGRVVAEDEVVELTMMRVAREVLAAAGFERYEVSNFARPGSACRHNLNYWRNGEYLGLGPSAVSYLNGVRRGNVADWQEWERIVLSGDDAAVSGERLDPTGAAAEELMVRLRLAEGADLAAVGRRYDIDAEGTFGPVMHRFRGYDLLAEDEGRWSFTDQGLEVADGVLAEIIAAARCNLSGCSTVPLPVDASRTAPTTRPRTQ